MASHQMQRICVNNRIDADLRAAVNPAGSEERQSRNCPTSNRSRRRRISFDAVNSTAYRIAAAVGDFMALASALQIAVLLRGWIDPIMPVHLTAEQLTSLAPPLGVVIALWLIVATRLRLYKRTSAVSAGTHLLHALETASVLWVLMVIVMFFSRQVRGDVSRSIVLLYAASCFATLLMSRYLAIGVAVYLGRSPAMRDRVLVVGGTPEAHDIVQQLSGRASDIAVVGIVVPRSEPQDGVVEGPMAPGFSILGGTPRLAELINTERVNRIIIAPGLDQGEIDHCTGISKRMQVVISQAVRHAASDVRVDFTVSYGLPQIEIHPIAFTKRQQIVKRVFDVVVSAVTITALAPVFAIIAFLIKITSRGPVLYTNQRVGRGGRHFEFLKFRSMYCDRKVVVTNEKSGHIFKNRHDPRITAIGRVLRRYSLDELPQLVNVLAGDMSLIGPRPLPAADLSPDGMSRDHSLWAELRAQAPPGITGLWQVNGRSDLDFAEMMQLDIEYIRNWSLALDFRILLETPLAVLSGRGAY